MSIDSYINRIETSLDNCENGKATIAEAITSKGVVTSHDESFSKMASNIMLISSGSGGMYDIQQVIDGDTCEINIVDASGNQGGIIPTGTLDITENGTYDVTEYDSVDVNVSSSNEVGGIEPCTVNVDMGLYSTLRLHSGYVMTYINQDGEIQAVKQDEYIPRNLVFNTIKNSIITIIHTLSPGIEPPISFYGCNVTRLSSTSITGGHITVIKPNESISSVAYALSCFLPDTLITISDGSRKQIKDITYDDKILVWDFDNGTYGTADICWLTRGGFKNDHYYKLTFSDGTVLCTTGQNSNHKVYNVDDRFFEGVAYIEIGKRVFTENGIVTLVEKEYIEEQVEYYNLMTTHKINCFANGVLTSDRYGNLYPINEQMKYEKSGRTVKPYSEFEKVGISKYWYDKIRLGEADENINKAREYVAKCEAQMLSLPKKDGE